MDCQTWFLILQS